MADAAPAVPTCLNCEFPLAPERLNYCPMCGQETELKPPTLREFAQQFGGSYIAVEGALWRSLKLLLTRPGALTREYLDGRRRRYVLPLRLYLTVSLIALLLLRVVAAASIERVEAKHEVQAPRHMQVGFGFGSAELRDGKFTCNDLPDWMCNRLRARFDVEPKQVVNELNRFVERTLSNVGTAMFLLLPSLALWLWLLYRNRRMNYTEHLVFALHVHAFWFVMVGLMLIGWDWLIALAGVTIPVYLLMAMRRVYAGRWWPQLLRAATVSVLYGVTLMTTMTLLLWVTVLF